MAIEDIVNVNNRSKFNDKIVADDVIAQRDVGRVRPWRIAILVGRLQDDGDDRATTDRPLTARIQGAAEPARAES